MKSDTPRDSWLTAPVAFFLLLAALLATWALVEPATLIRNFDRSGYSPFELATIPVFAAIVPLVWWKCPFGGSVTRRRLLCAAVSLVAVMAIVKELDLHIALLRWLYPDYITADGVMAPGVLFRADGSPRAGTPFKMPVLKAAAVPLGMKACIVAYFSAFFGVFAAGFAYLARTWVKGVFRLEAASWSFGCFCGSGVLAQVADRLPAWLGHAHGLRKAGEDGVVSSAASLCTALEEGGEMMLALFALLTILLAWRAGRNPSRGA